MATWSQGFQGFLLLHFRQLKTLRLANLSFLQCLLSSFTTRHSASLKSSSLGPILLCTEGHDEFSGPFAGIQRGPTQEFLAGFRDNLDLDKFETLFTPQDTRLYDESWDAICKSSQSHLDLETPSQILRENVQLLEIYVLGLYS